MRVRTSAGPRPLMHQILGDTSAPATWRLQHSRCSPLAKSRWLQHRFNIFQCPDTVRRDDNTAGGWYEIGEGGWQVHSTHMSVAWAHSSSAMPAIPRSYREARPPYEICDLDFSTCGRKIEICPGRQRLGSRFAAALQSSCTARAKQQPRPVARHRTRERVAIPDGTLGQPLLRLESSC